MVNSKGHIHIMQMWHFNYDMGRYTVLELINKCLQNLVKCATFDFSDKSSLWVGIIKYPHMYFHITKFSKGFFKFPISNFSCLYIMYNWFLLLDNMNTKARIIWSNEKVLQKFHVGIIKVVIVITYWRRNKYFYLPLWGTILAHQPWFNNNNRKNLLFKLSKPKTSTDSLAYIFLYPHTPCAVMNSKTQINGL